MEKNENLDICRECGGMCCKKCGCDYAPSDFDDLSYKALLSVLSEGKISIVATLNFMRLGNGKLISTPILYLRARNVDRDVVDLLSMKTKCSQLTDTGCSYSYEDRPRGGVNLTPSNDGPCRPMDSPIDMILSWVPYQKSLRKIVKNYTGMTVEQKLKKDAASLFDDYYHGKLAGVAEAELDDLSTFIPLLAEVYPDEFKNAVGISCSKVFSKKV